jgi:hypothetical protein
MWQQLMLKGNQRVINCRHFGEVRANPEPDHRESPSRAAPNSGGGPDGGMAPGAYLPYRPGEEGGPHMYHSEYAMRLLAEQHNSELLGEVERLNQRRAQHRRRRRYLRSFLVRLRRPAPSSTVIDLRERATGTEGTTPACETGLHPSR